MAIKTGQRAGLVAVTSSDTTLDDNSSAGGGSHEYYAHYFHNTNDSASAVTVEVFISSDSASATGERVDYLSLADQETKAIKPVVLDEGEYLIAKASATGLNWYGSFIKRTGSDI